MKVIFLGTNGWYTSPTGNTACVLIDSKDNYVIFDAGNGFYKLDQYIIEDKPVSLFISHFHIDHASGLHSLNKFNWPQGLDVYLGDGRSKDFETLVSPPFTIGLALDPTTNTKQKMDIRIHELKEATRSHLGGLNMEAIEQQHAFRNHGYRIVLNNKIIAYSGDCGITEASLQLAKDADLLIHECSWKAMHPPSNWGHVGPIEAARLAKDAGVKKLILTHFDASLYTSLDQRIEAEKQAQKVFPNTVSATDDLVVNL